MPDGYFRRSILEVSQPCFDGHFRGLVGNQSNYKLFSLKHRFYTPTKISLDTTDCFSGYFYYAASHSGVRPNDSLF